MTVKVGDVMSMKRPVQGGCTQGSILGVFLFNPTIDDLEEGCPDIRDYAPDDMNEEESVDLDSSNEPFDAVEEVRSRQATHSTPTRPFRGDSPQDSPILGLHEGSRRKITPLELTFEERCEIPEEINHWTETKWRAELAEFLRFIDDGFSLSK